MPSPLRYTRLVVFCCTVLLLSSCSTPNVEKPTTGSPRSATFRTLTGTRPTGVPEIPDSPVGWWATSWTTIDGSGFFGKPATRTANLAETISIRYTQFTSTYDARLRAPRWAAYTLKSSAVDTEYAGTRSSTQPAYRRPSAFFQEPLVLSLSSSLGLEPAADRTYTDSIDPRFPILEDLTPKKAQVHPRIIQRGHMVPNNAMKSTGNAAEGRRAQLESFSLANVVPQMRNSNAPTWAALESACFDWARELDQIWVIVGPVFDAPLRPALMRKRTKDENTSIAVPDSIFCVVIGKRENNVSAIGFLLPHTPEELDFRLYAFQVDEIEMRTGLNFMPELGEPNSAEVVFQSAWLHTPARSKPPRGE